MNLKEWGERLGFDFYDPRFFGEFYFKTEEEAEASGLDEFSDSPERVAAMEKVFKLSEEEEEDFWQAKSEANPELNEITQKYDAEMRAKGFRPWWEFMM